MSRIISVSDSLQTYSYKLTEPEGCNFHPDFKPELTPKQMLELGVFNGDYLKDSIKEIPAGWLTNAKITTTADPSVNFFEISASQPWSVWQANGWIFPDDPRGWFQWYWRYYLGRRIPDEDLRQIKRWKAFKRHIAQIRKNCRMGDYACRPRQRQALLHWAYDSRKI